MTPLPARAVPFTPRLESVDVVPCGDCACCAATRAMVDDLLDETPYRYTDLARHGARHALKAVLTALDAWS